MNKKRMFLSGNFYDLKSIAYKPVKIRLFSDILFIISKVFNVLIFLWIFLKIGFLKSSLYNMIVSCAKETYIDVKLPANCHKFVLDRFFLSNDFPCP